MTLTINFNMNRKQGELELLTYIGRYLHIHILKRKVHDENYIIDSLEMDDLLIYMKEHVITRKPGLNFRHLQQVTQKHHGLIQKMTLNGTSH